MSLHVLLPLFPPYVDLFVVLRERVNVCVCLDFVACNSTFFLQSPTGDLRLFQHKVSNVPLLFCMQYCVRTTQPASLRGWLFLQYVCYLLLSLASAASLIFASSSCRDLGAYVSCTIMRTAGPAVTHETKYPALNNDVLRALYATNVPRRLITPTVPRTRETLLLVLVVVLPPALFLFSGAWDGDDDDIITQILQRTHCDDDELKDKDPCQLPGRKKQKRGCDF